MGGFRAGLGLIGALSVNRQFNQGEVNVGFESL